MKPSYHYIGNPFIGKAASVYQNEWNFKLHIKDFYRWKIVYDNLWKTVPNIIYSIGMQYLIGHWNNIELVI